MLWYMKKIAIIGATGNAGSVIFKEAPETRPSGDWLFATQTRGVGILPSDAELIQQDAFALTHQRITKIWYCRWCFGTTVDQAYLHIDLAGSSDSWTARDYFPTHHCFILVLAAQKLDGDVSMTCLKRPFRSFPSSTRPRISSENISCCNGPTTLTGLVFHRMIFQHGPATEYVRGDNTL